MRIKSRVAVFILVLLGVAFISGRRDPARLDAAAMAGFLTQDVCLDSAGGVVPGLPFDRLCTRRRHQTLDDAAPYRKHDRPNASQASALPLGYQASDSVASAERPDRLAVQTMDFGDAPRRYGVFDSSPDDGGQVIVIRNGSAYGALTQDGGRHGLQWFLGPLCGFGGDYGARFESWLVFRDDASSGEWREAIADLNIAPSEADCPASFGRAYTRYRREQIALPVFRQDRHGVWQESATTFDTIVSEHYGRESIANADHLERFYFSAGLGMVRWERWEQLGLSILPDVPERALAMAQTQRCGHVAYSDPPGEAWRMIDCRMWTTFEPLTGPWRVADYGWPPALTAFDR